MNENKKWYKSKTICFNVAGALLIGVEQNFTLLESIIGNNAYGTILFVVTMVNIGLRTITTTGVSK